MTNEPWRAEDHPFYEDPAKPWLGGFRIGGDIATQFEALWTWLVEEHGIKSVVDIGCGDGQAVKFFETLLPFGQVLGIDGVPQEHTSIVEHDYTKGPFEIAREYDLIWCIEVVEHIDEVFLPNLLSTIRCAPSVLISHAAPGQQGHHHVNCQMAAYWIGAFAGIGYRLDHDLTRQCRKLAAANKSEFNHFLRSGMCFVRTS